MMPVGLSTRESKILFRRQFTKWRERKKEKEERRSERESQFGFISQRRCNSVVGQVAFSLETQHNGGLGSFVRRSAEIVS